MYFGSRFLPMIGLLHCFGPEGRHTIKVGGMCSRGCSFLFSFFFDRTRVWTQPFALVKQSRCSTAWATSPVHFSLVILEMGSCELFAQAGFETWSSQSQPPRITGMSHWCLAKRTFLSRKKKVNWVKVDLVLCHLSTEGMKEIMHTPPANQHITNSMYL
jgi:hypothetical protein